MASTDEKTMRQRIARLWASIDGFRQNKPYTFWLLAVPGTGAVLGLLVLGLLIAAVYLGAFGDLPTRQTLASIETPEASWLLDRNGEFLSRYYKENREVAELDELPPALIEALIATEDARFFEHSGIDWQATARAILFSVILQQREQGGGSTLSQQLAKRHFPRHQNKGGIVVAKIREAITANRFEDLYSKEELLALYLNSVHFGEGISGVKLAARRFFNADIIDLTTEQAAVLVGMLKATTAYNPALNPERALERRNLVLHRMTTEGFLTETQRDSLMALPLALNERLDRARAQTSYFSERIKPELVHILDSLNETRDLPLELYTSGLRIYTTLDAEVQAMAEQAVQASLKEIQPTFFEHWKGRSPEQFAELLREEIKGSARYRSLLANGLSPDEAMARFGESQEITFGPHAAEGAGTRTSTWRDSVRMELLRLRAGFIVADPADQALLAYVGGGDFAAVPFNAARAKRQVGSTFKPLVYAAAIEQGVQPCTYLPNELRTYTDFKDWTPENADGEYGGEYSLVGGLVNSVNTVAVQLIFEAGVDNVKDLAREIGLRDIPAEPSIALGTPSLSLEEMVRLYGMFALRGVVPNYHFIDRIETREGELLYAYTPKELGRPVLNPQSAEVVDYAMRKVVERGTGVGLSSRFGVRSEVAGKTGTTQNQADGWFMGYTDDLVVGAWMGGAYPSIRWRSLSRGQGARTALPIAGRFLRAYERKRGVRRLPELSEGILIETNCEDFLEFGQQDTLFGPGGPDFEAIFRELFKQRRDREEAQAEPARPRRSGDLPRTDQQRQARQRQAAEQRRQREAARKQRERERKREARKQRRKKALDKLFGKPQ